jgi:hypothetical protein
MKRSGTRRVFGEGSSSHDGTWMGSAATGGATGVSFAGAGSGASEAAGSSAMAATSAEFS